MKQALLVIAALLWTFTLSAQKITISGMVTDAETGENLLSANVYEQTTYNGTVTNEFGFYNLTLLQGANTIVCSYMGYTEQIININISRDTVIHFKLSPSIEIEEVTVMSEGPMEKVRSSQMSTLQLPVVQAKKLPALLGEVDIIKSLQLMPGVSGGVEGSSGIYVRGGGPDQNLFLLDGVPVYNPSHIFGLFSVFNADAVKSVSIMKGGFPARYGGRLSSVIDVRMKDGNMKEFHGEGSIGLLSAKASIEGPIIKDRTSFIISGRRTYYDAIIFPIQEIINKADESWGYNSKLALYFYDFNAKVNHIINDNNRLFISTYIGRDNFRTKVTSKDENAETRYYYRNTSEDKLNWGNATTALRWNHIFSARMFSNADVTFSNYSYNTGSFTEFVKSEDYEGRDSVNYQSNNSNYYSKIKDFTFKYNVEYKVAMNHQLRFGLSNTLHYFSPGLSFDERKTLNGNADIDTIYGEADIPGNEFYAYIEDDFTITPRLKANMGLHYGNFHVRDTMYHSLQPRISLRYLLRDNLSLKAGYANMEQNLHLLTNSTVGLPNDLWIPATDQVSPQKSWQASVGAILGIDNDYEISLEAYYKEMKNLTEYVEGGSYLSLDDNWESLVTQGQGRSYGLEFFFQKTMGKTTGWIGYTLSKTERQFDEISFGRVFPYKYDRRHDISIVFNHKFNERIDVGAAWVYATGNAFTLADEFYVSQKKYEDVLNGVQKMDDYYNYSGFGYGMEPDDDYDSYFKFRNSYRMPTYHRLDVSLNMKKQKNKFLRTWSFGAYNVYAKQNPLYVRETLAFNEENLRWEPGLRQFSIFSFIPYARLSYKF